MLSLLELAVLFGVFTSGAAESNSCVHNRGTGMLPNYFENDGEAGFPGANFTDSAAGPDQFREYELNNPFVMLGGDTVQHMKIHDYGFVELISDAEKSTPGFDTFFDYDPSGIAIGSARKDRFYAATKWFDTPATLGSNSFLFSTYHIDASDQRSGGVGTGPSKCILEMAAARIDRCDDSPRGTTVIEELVVITWKISSGTGGGSKETRFQMVLAIDTTAGKSYIVMIYDDDNPIGDPTNLATFAGYINGGLTATSQSIYNLICNSVDSSTPGHGPETPTTDAEMTYIYNSSNCRCGSPGTYVFTLTENNPADDYLETVCTDQSLGGTGDTSPDNVCQAGYDDGKTFNRNCRVPVEPWDTCRETAYCITKLTNENETQMTIYFHDPAFDTVSFVDYNNAMISRRTLKTSPACQGVNITDNKVTIDVDINTSPSCVELSTDKTMIEWAVEVTEETGKHVDGNEIIYGACTIADLPRMATVTANIGDIASTMLPLRTDRELSLELLDRNGYSNGFQRLDDNSVPIRLGRQVFILVCLKRGTPYNVNADPWGIYVTNVVIANNAEISDDGSTNHAKTVVNGTGCKVTPDDPDIDFYVESGPKKTDLVKTGFDMCQVVGSFEAKKHTDSDDIWVSVQIGTCHNTEIADATKCDDSCLYTDTNAALSRRRREVEGFDDIDNPVTLRTSMKIGSGYAASTVTCVERTMAMTTIVALIALIVMATVAAILLFIKLQMRKKK